MAVYHVLNDGTVTTDISGHVVRLDDPEVLCQIVARVSQKKSKVRNTTNTYEQEKEVHI